MKKCITIFLISVLLVLCFGCKKTDLKTERLQAFSKESTEDIPLDVPSSVTQQIQPEEDMGLTEYTIQPSNLEIENANKTVITKPEDFKEHTVIEYNYSYSPENNKKVVQHCDNNAVKNGESLNSKTYVYSVEYLKTLFNPKGDKGACVFNDNNKQYMIDVMAICPTEAVRKTDKGYYLVYDTEENMRVFAWFEQLNGDPWYHQIGYSIYIAETLSYSDFECINIGDDALEVEAIDPKIVEMNLRFHRECEEPEHTQIGIENGFAPKSIHLLTDGIIKFTYGRNEEMFYVTDIEYFEDFTMDTVAGPQCCKINPLDYVTQG